MKNKFNRVCLMCLLVFGIYCDKQNVFSQEGDWVGTWGCGLQLTEPKSTPPLPGLSSNTLRQVVHVTIGGKRLRAKFSNAYGTNAVEMNSVHVALNIGATATSTIDPATDKELTFNGVPSVVIPPGKDIWSDPLDFNLPPLANLTITIHFGATSGNITGHPGSRTTSYILPGNAVTSADMAGAVKTEHWYHIAGVDVLAKASNKALVTLGDSITDGRGSTTDANNRWPDVLAARLHTNAPTAGVGVINVGIGGNGIFGGIGPAATKRFDRDVLNQSGVRWVIIFEGVNDIGSRNSTPAIATNLIAAYKQFITKAHARSILVYGATITPFGGAGYYSPEHEVARQTVNTWIRTNDLYDAVIDFDAAVRNPLTVTNILPAYDSDHLHLSPAGYRALAESVNLNLFAP